MAVRLFLVTVEGEIAAGPIAAAVAQSGHGLRSATVVELRGADETTLRLAPLTEAYRRLGVQDAAGATVEALRRGWIRATEDACG